MPQWPAALVVALAAVAGLTVASWNGIQFAEVARLAPPGSLNEAMAGATLLLLGAYVLWPAVFALSSGGGFRLGFVLTAIGSVAALWPLVRRRE